MTKRVMTLHFGDPAPTEDMTAPKNDEERAREVFGPHIGGDLVAFSPDPPDFVLCRDGTIVGWAEATTAIPEEVASFRKALEGKSSFTTNRLIEDWVISCEPDASLKRLYGNLDQLIDACQRYEETHPDETIRRRFDAVDNREVGETFRTLRIANAGPIRLADGNAKVYVDMVPMSSWVGPELVNELAETKANEKADSLRGLDGERHLLLGVDAYWPNGAAFALADREAPVRPPDLPDTFSDVWMTWAVHLIWHFSKDVGAWEVIQVGSGGA